MEQHGHRPVVGRSETMTEGEDRPLVGSVWSDACVVATYETTYSSIFTVTTNVTDVAVASRCCVLRSWRCAADKKEHRKEKNGFHETPNMFIGGQAVILQEFQRCAAPSRLSDLDQRGGLPDERHILHCQERVDTM